MLLDTADITISGGHGGAGKVSFGKMWKSGPDGGNGGNGGDVYIVGSSDLTLLNQFSVETDFSAEDGKPGAQSKKAGKQGQDLEIRLPIGTTVTEVKTERQPGFFTHGEVYEITSVNDRFLVAKGGRGGKGNWEFRAPHRTTPTFAQPGLAGEKRHFHIDLKLIADFGFIGLPNAGKSSLLNELTRAKAKVGNFAFTTLSPNLGTLEGTNSILADIPGLIEGAHEGRGLGIRFLKHIEKVRVLLHCISAETQDLAADYKTVRTELGNYNKAMLKKEEVLLLTKTDMVDEKQLKKLVTAAKKLNKHVLVASIFNFDQIEGLKKELLSRIN